jgi:cytoskeletal protein RodZ
MGAMLRQISPQTAVKNFEAIATASSAMISTNIPPGEVDRFISLALQARSQKISTVSLVPPMVVTAHPDVSTIKTMVAAAIARAEGRTDPTPADAEPETTLAAPADTPTSEAPAETPASTPADPASQAPTEPAPQPEVVTGGSVGNLSNGYAANQTDDLGASC